MKRYICYIGYYISYNAAKNVQQQLLEYGFTSVMKVNNGFYHLEVMESYQKKLIEDMVNCLFVYGFFANMMCVKEDYTGETV